MPLTRPSALWIGTIVAFVVLAGLAAVRAADWSYGADTGTFVQIILDAFGGMRNGMERTTHYRFHWSPTLVLLWPFLAATHSLWVLQTILAAATVACAPPLSTREATCSSTEDEAALTSTPAALSRARTSLGARPRSLAISCTRLFISLRFSLGGRA